MWHIWTSQFLLTTYDYLEGVEEGSSFRFLPLPVPVPSHCPPKWGIIWGQEITEYRKEQALLRVIFSILIQFQSFAVLFRNERIVLHRKSIKNRRATYASGTVAGVWWSIPPWRSAWTCFSTTLTLLFISKGQYAKHTCNTNKLLIVPVADCDFHSAKW